MTPAVAIVCSPRSDWSGDLQRHLANHGGARVRRMVLEPRVALEEDYEILVCEDAASFLTQRFVDRLRDREIALLGVFSTEEPAGRDRLVSLGFDAVLTSDAPMSDFVREIAHLAPRRDRSRIDGASLGQALPPKARGESSRGRVTVVGGASGGCGATEVAIALAVITSDGADGTVLYDADDVSPAIAVRLNQPPTPNIRNAIDACRHGLGVVEDSLRPVQTAGFQVLAGLPHAADWAQLRATDVCDVIDQVCGRHRNVVVNVGCRVEDLSAFGGPHRYGLTRAMYGVADAVVGVGAPSPTGVVRLLEWASEVRRLVDAADIHMVISRAPRSGFKRGEIEREIRRTFGPASLTFLPADRRVEEAAWASAVIRGGPFSKALCPLAVRVAGGPAGGRDESWRYVS